MQAYFAIKFYEDSRRRDLIESILNSLKAAGIDSSYLSRDYEEWGKKHFEPKELMKIAFKEIDNADFVLMELTEKGIGLGIEAGYAYAKKKPVIIIAKEGTEISETVKGIAEEIIFYNDPKEIAQKIRFIKKD